MQDADLFIGLAGIAGVFVGFGALIAVRSSGPSDPFEVTHVRFVVWIGMLAVVAALAPVTISPYGLGEHTTWVLSSGIIAVAYLGMGVVNMWLPETKAAEFEYSRTLRVIESGASLLVGVPILIAMVIIVLGLRPELDLALYRTIVVMLLFGAGETLLLLVYLQRRPASA